MTVGAGGTYTAGAGVDIDAERKNISEEKVFKEKHPEIYGLPSTQTAPGLPGGKPGALPGGKPPALGAPAPTAPRGAYNKRKYGADNPYVSRDVLDEVRDVLEQSLDVDADGKVIYDEISEVLEQLESTGPALSEEHLGSGDVLAGIGD